MKIRIEDLSEMGNCDFCNSQNVSIMNLTKASHKGIYAANVASDFEDIIDQYTTEVPNDLIDKSHKISDFLSQVPNLFKIDNDKIATFLKELLLNRYSADPDLFDKVTIPVYLKNKDYMKKYGIFKGKSWSDFEHDIKFNNRFHSKMSNDKILLAFFDDCSVKLSVGKRLYRARISKDKLPIGCRQMGAAPLGFSQSGRLNASGIGYLYLSDDWEVALKEIKAAVNDVCTVATFEVKEPLHLVDLSQIINISIFNSPEKDVYLMNQDILQDIDGAMRKSSTKDRSEVAYAPTEYMSDLIKSMKVDGIMYKSTISTDRDDVVLFSGKKLNQIVSDIRTYRITGLTYETKRLPEE
ncbi:MAG: RES family NAD+ phosphorylase [Leuconostoc mesenteroides]